MYLLVWFDRFIDQFQEIDEVLGWMPLFCFGNDLSGRHVEGCEQVERGAFPKRGQTRNCLKLNGAAAWLYKDTESHL